MAEMTLGDGERYWLAHSEGFRVDSHGGRVGLVEDVLQARTGEPYALVVRAGMTGSRSLVVPVEQVEGIAPRRERIMLRRTPDAGGTGCARDLLGRLRDPGDRKRAA